MNILHIDSAITGEDSVSRKLTAEMPPQTDAATLVRAMRDDDRY